MNSYEHFFQALKTIFSDLKSFLIKKKFNNGIILNTTKFLIY